MAEPLFRSPFLWLRSARFDRHFDLRLLPLFAHLPAGPMLPSLLCRWLFGFARGISQSQNDKKSAATKKSAPAKRSAATKKSAPVKKSAATKKSATAKKTTAKKSTAAKKSSAGKTASLKGIASKKSSAKTTPHSFRQQQRDLDWRSYLSYRNFWSQSMV